MYKRIKNNCTWTTLDIQYENIAFPIFLNKETLVMIGELVTESSRYISFGTKSSIVARGIKKSIYVHDCS